MSRMKRFGPEVSPTQVLALECSQFFVLVPSIILTLFIFSPSLQGLQATGWYQAQPYSAATFGLKINPFLKYSRTSIAHAVHVSAVHLCRAYEPRFGTEDNPIQVPALLSERIIGVTDPEDDTLVIWGIIREVGKDNML